MAQADESFAKTTKRGLDGLMRAAAEAIGCERSEVFGYVKAVQKTIADSLRPYGFSGVQVSPYSHESWTLTAIRPEFDSLGFAVKGRVRSFTLPFEFAEFWSDPTEIVGEFCELIA